MSKSRADELRARADRRRHEGPIPNDRRPRTTVTSDPLAALFEPPPMASVIIDFDNLDYQKVEMPRWAFKALRDIVRSHLREADEQCAGGNKAQWALVWAVTELRKSGWTSNIIEVLIYWAIWGRRDAAAMRDIGVPDLEIIYRTKPVPNPNPRFDPGECFIVSVETRRVVKH